MHEEAKTKRIAIAGVEVKQGFELNLDRNMMGIPKTTPVPVL